MLHSFSTTIFYQSRLIDRSMYLIDVSDRSINQTQRPKLLEKNATPKQLPTSAKRIDLREDITCRDGKQLIFCKGCNKETCYAGWSQHCITHTSKLNGKANVDDGDKDDDGPRSKTQPKSKG